MLSLESSVVKISNKMHQDKLGLCTETLGCVSGETYGAIEDSREESIRSCMSKIIMRKRSIPKGFPPPLPRTLSLLRLGRARVEGRLMLVPFRTFTRVLEAERGEGCLLLRLQPSWQRDICILCRVGKNDTMKDRAVKGIIDEEEEEMVIGKYRRTTRCKEGQVGSKRDKMVFYSSDALSVASS